MTTLEEACRFTTRCNRYDCACPDCYRCRATPCVCIEPIARQPVCTHGTRLTLICDQCIAATKADMALAAVDTTKQTNPKDAVGVRKARWFSYLPLRVLVGVGLALLEGARKYGRHNYRIAGVRASVYVDAVVCGHLMPWMEGEDLDPDTAELDDKGQPIPGTGISHIDKAIASLVVLRDGMYENNWVDDRPPSVKDWPAFIKQAHHSAGKIIDRYSPAVPAYTIADTKHKEG